MILDGGRAVGRAVWRLTQTRKMRLLCAVVNHGVIEP